jgi:hypothetical protein
MIDAPDQDVQRPAAPARPPRWPRRRIAKRLGVGLCVVALALMVMVGALWARLLYGPLAAPWIGARIEAALERALGRGADIEIGEVNLRAGPHGPVVALQRLRLRDADGATVLNAPSAEATIDLWSAMFSGAPVGALDLVGVELRLEAKPDGSLSLALGGDDAKTITFQGAPARDGAPEGPAPVTQAAMSALAAFVDAIAAADGPLGALTHVGLSQGKLVVAGAGGKTLLIYTDLSAFFARRRHEAAAKFSLSAKGPQSQPSIEAEASLKDGRRALDLALAGLTFDEAAVFAGFHDAPVDVDLTISARLALTLTPEGRLDAASGRFSAGSGYVRLDDVDHEPFLIDSLAGGFRWDAPEQAIVVEPTQLLSGETRLSVAGQLKRLDPEGSAWGYVLSSTDNKLAGEAKADGAMSLGDLSATGRYTPAAGVLAVERLQFSGGEAALSMSGELVGGDAGPALRADIQARRMKARDLMRFWPSVVAPEARRWFLSSFKGGVLDAATLKLALDREVFLTPKGTPAPDAAVDLEFEVSDAALDYLPGAPPLTGVAGKGRVTGRTASFEAKSARIDVGPGRRLSVVEARVDMPDFAPTPMSAKIVARVQGGLDAALDYLARPAFKTFVSLPAAAQSARGQLDARLTIDLELGPGAREPRARVEAQTANVAIDQFLGSEKLEGGALAISADGQNLTVKGTGRLFGAPATIETRNADRPEAVVTVTLDEGQRARRGMAIAGLGGLVAARLTTPLPEPGRAPPRRAQVELDLSRASFDGLFGALSKPAGKPAKATFALAEQDGGFAVDAFAFEGAGAMARGAGVLGQDGVLKSFKLTQVKLSPGDDLRLEGQKAAEGLKLVARGAALDARPFLKALVGPGSAGPTASGAGDLDLDLKTTLLTGHNRQAMGPAELRLVKRGGKLRQFSLVGRFGKDAVTATLGKDGETILFDTEDAGSALGFLDLYRRMEGGSLSAVAKIGDARVDASFTIRRFLLRDEPAMRRLVAESAAARGGEGLSSARVDVQSVPFERLHARLTRNADRLTIHDGALSGPTLGLTVAGVVETRSERLALAGAFVPAYAINNFFARLPLFGPILGGGKEEGLFAVNYRLSGTLSQPAVVVNPLSAIAPGFLRSIFSFDTRRPGFEPGGEGDPAAPLKLDGVVAR